MVLDFFQARAQRVADGQLADRVDALTASEWGSVLEAAGWRPDPADTSWTHNGEWHFSIIRRRHDRRWGFSGELAVLGAVASRMGLVGQASWPAPSATNPGESELLVTAGWTEADQLTRLTFPCFERREGRRRAIAAYSVFNKTFVPTWCGGGDLYLCLHAAAVLAGSSTRFL